MKKTPVAAALLLLLLAAAPAHAESAFLFPQVGLGTGPSWVDGEYGRAAALDLLFGADWELSEPFATGFTAGFELEGAEGRGGTDWWRFSLTSMLTGSIGYWDPLPFLRLGAGPSLAFTRLSDRPYTLVGLGLTVEAATGLRSFLEVYAQATSVFDPLGVSTSAMVGVRLNAWIADLLFGGGHGHFHGSHGGSHEASRGGSEHRAVPAR